MKGPADIMIICAHPDDAEFGVGGSVAKWTDEGKEVVYVVCTSGEKGTTDRDIDPADLAKTREGEQRDAAGVLGVREVVFLRYPDQGLEDTAEFRKEIAREIRKFKPYTVVTMDPYRKYIWHRDHRMVGLVTIDAVYPFARDHLAYPDLIEEGLEPHKVREIMFWGAEEINCRIDISGKLEQKLKALGCHKSQVKEMGEKNAEEWIIQHCRELAAGESYEYGEAFHRVEIPS